LRPGIPELSETIKVRSIVGRFLEHSRIYRFGGTEFGEKTTPLTILTGSADLMERNLDRRIEVLAPVKQPDLQARLLEILDLVFSDDTNAWTLSADRKWHRNPSREGINSQDLLMEMARDRVRRRREIELS
jgi:polyphosphate kinase